jgi:glutamate dehydrogenase
MQVVIEQMPDLHEAEWIKLWSAEKHNLTELNVDDGLAARIAASDSIFLSLGIVDTALRQQKPIEQTAQLYFTLGEYLSLDWFMAQIVGLQPQNRWQDLARESYVDDLESQRRRLTASLLKQNISDVTVLLDTWQTQQQPLIDRWQAMIKDLRRGTAPDFAMISVALRELLDLVQSSVDSVRPVDTN